MKNLNLFVSDCVLESEELRNIGSGDNKPKPLTSAILAEGMAKAMRKNSLIDNLGSIYVFNGKMYEKMDELGSSDCLKASIIGIMQNLNVGMVYTIDSVVKKIKFRFMAECIKEIKKSNNLLCFRNGVLNIETGGFVAHSKALVPFAYLDFDYNAEAECPVWEKYILDSMGERQSRILQEFLSLILIDRRRYFSEGALMMVGKNNKVIKGIYSVINMLLGEHNCSHTDLRYICKGNKSDHAAALIDGNLVNFCDDMGTFKVEKGRFSHFIERSSMHVRLPYRMPHVIKETPLLVGYSNAMPVINRANKHVWERVSLINLEDSQESVISLEDVENEFSGIFNWVVLGKERFFNNGIFTFKTAL